MKEKKVAILSGGICYEIDDACAIVAFRWLDVDPFSGSLRPVGLWINLWNGNRQHGCGDSKCSGNRNGCRKGHDECADVSNGSGEFTADHLIPDIYDVKIAVSGFQAFEQTGIQVFADTSTKIQAVLNAGASTETVEVTADAVSAAEDRPRRCVDGLWVEGDSGPADRRAQLYRSAAAASGRAGTWLESRCERKSAGQQTDHGGRPGLCRNCV